MRLNQIPDKWHQIAARFRCANASVMTIESEVIGEYVEGIWIEVWRKILRMVLVCVEF